MPQVAHGPPRKRPLGAAAALEGSSDRANQLPLVGAEESDWNAAQRRNAADVSRPFQLGRCWLFVDFERVAARGVLNRKKPLFIFCNLCLKFSLIFKEK